MSLLDSSFVIFAAVTYYQTGLSLGTYLVLNHHALMAFDSTGETV